jgi:hypothetical protein
VPSPLSLHALTTVLQVLSQHHKRHAPVLPVFSMVDRRRASHRAAIEANPDWPVIAYASVVEKMAATQRPVGALAARAPVSEALRTLWKRIEKQLSRTAKARAK